MFKEAVQACHSSKLSSLDLTYKTYNITKYYFKYTKLLLGEPLTHSNEYCVRLWVSTNDSEGQGHGLFLWIVLSCVRSSFILHVCE